MRGRPAVKKAWQRVMQSAIRLSICGHVREPSLFAYEHLRLLLLLLLLALAEGKEVGQAGSVYVNKNGEKQCLHALYHALHVLQTGPRAISSTTAVLR